MQDSAPKRLTTEAKLRILFRLVRAASEALPCVKEIKVVAETAVDIVDEYRKGAVVCSRPDSITTAGDSASIDPIPDVSFSILSQELQFAHISFGDKAFRDVLADSGTIQLEDCLIALLSKTA